MSCWVFLKSLVRECLSSVLSFCTPLAMSVSLPLRNWMASAVMMPGIDPICMDAGSAARMGKTV